MRILFLLAAAILFASQAAAQPPVPAPRQSRPIVISGGTAHIGDGQVIHNSLLVVEGGRFSVVADAASVAGPRMANALYLDATGQHIYPGFIALKSTLGLTEIDMVRATRDFTEVGAMTPSVRALIAYNTDSDILPVVRSNGVLLAQSIPSGGRLPGQSSVFQLDAWNWEDAAVRADDGLHLYWPDMYTFSFPEFREKRNENYNAQVDELERYFQEARAYTYRPAGEPVNLGFEAMRGLFDGQKRLYIHAQLALCMQEAVLFAKKMDITPVIVGGRDAWLIADFLKKNDVAVILQKVQSLPSRQDEDIDQPFKTPALLKAADIRFGFSTDGSWQQFNLPFQAGQALGYGLDYEAAVQALTLDPARILGIDKDFGSLEVGKDATFFISAGDALDMRTNQVTEAFIQGRQISLDNKHKELYHRFQAKYEQNKK